MIADLYFIRFRSMVVEDLEMVRLWRNSDTVRAAMLYKNLITAEQQQLWYQRICNANNFFFIIESITRRPFIFKIPN